MYCHRKKERSLKPSQTKGDPRHGFCSTDFFRWLIFSISCTLGAFNLTFMTALLLFGIVFLFPAWILSGCASALVPLNQKTEPAAGAEEKLRHTLDMALLRSALARQ